MNWGKGLMLTMAAFAGLMTWLVVRSIQAPEPLVAEDYYEQELRYQQRIDALTRANALGEPVRAELLTDGLRLQFPHVQHGQAIQGHVLLLRPNDPNGDRAFTLRADTAGRFDTTALRLTRGRYDLAVDWSVNGLPYRYEQHTLAP